MGITERKEREKEQRRNDIIDAAENVFFSKSLENATMDEIAAAAELSKGTLYLYFNNKEDLFYAICMRALRTLRHVLEKAISTGNTGLENLVELGRAYAYFSREYNDYFKVITYFEAKQDIDPDMCTGNCQDCDMHKENSCPMELLMHVVDQGQKDRSARKDIPAPVMAHLLWSQATGVLQALHLKTEHIQGFGITKEELIASHFEIIRYGIEPKQHA